MSTEEIAIIRAAVDGDARGVRGLLAGGVSANVRDSETYSLGLEWNITPLMCAAAKGHAEAVRVLLDGGADVSAASDAHKQDGGPGSQALHHALAGGHAEIAKMLLDAGADPNALGRYGRTPLTCAVEAMSLEGVRLLLERGADVKLKPKRKDYQPPLYVAAAKINSTTSMVMRNGKFVPEISQVWERKEQVIEIFRLLIAAGANANATGPRNSPPLETLVAGDKMPDELRLPVAEMLLDAGARADLADKDGWSAIRTAERCGNARVIALLKRGVTAAAAPKAERPDSKPKATKAAKRAKTGGGASDAGEVGAAHFLKFISEGEDEWALLAIRAPIDDVTDAFARVVKAKAIRRSVPRKPSGGDGLDEVAPAVAIVEVRGNPWTIVLRSLFHVDEEIAVQTRRAAEALSKELKTSAIVFMSHGASDFPIVSTFEKGRAEAAATELPDDGAAEEFFRGKGVYLPACYPMAKGRRLWVAVVNVSSEQVERADLIEI